jgi:hypothetical protein
VFCNTFASEDPFGKMGILEVNPWQPLGAGAFEKSVECFSR